MELMRNALASAPLLEAEDPIMELRVLCAFTDALFHAHAVDEVEPLVARYREAAQAEGDKQGRPCFHDFHSLYLNARLHEVLCTCTPRVQIHFTLLDPCTLQGRYSLSQVSRFPGIDTCTR